MKIFKPLFMFALVVLTFGCAKDQLETPTATQETQDEQLAQQIIEKADLAIKEAKEQLLEEEVEERSGNTVYVMANSSNKVADAIAEAGPNGTVILAEGMHEESQTILITHRITLKGEPGAVLKVNTGLANFEDVPVVLTPAIHIQNADKVKIENLEIRPIGESGKVGILAEDAHRLRILDNTIFDFQLGIFLYGSDNTFVKGNYVEGLLEPEFHLGIMMMKGKNVKIFENELTQNGAGLFTSDRNGLAFDNLFQDNVSEGIILCTAPPTYALPGGTTIQAPESTNGWVVAGNESNNNGLTGYSVIDGAFDNILVGNSAQDNAILDIVLFGVLGTFPTSENNTVISVQNPEVTIMDCGLNNTVVGGTTVDCFL